MSYAEIKLIVLSLIGRATPTLLEGKFTVSDPLNTVCTSPLARSPYVAAIAYSDLRTLQVTQPPKGTLVMVPLEKPYL